MDNIRQYLLTIITAAVVCAIVRALTNNKGAPASIVQLIAAIFLVITVISPWKQLSFSDLTEHIKEYSDNADDIVNQGVATAQDATTEIIKEQIEAYIVNKGKSLGVTLHAEVSVGETSPIQPQSVIITANTSPYMKQKISKDISSELGIPEANQVWN